MGFRRRRSVSGKGGHETNRRAKETRFRLSLLVSRRHTQLSNATPSRCSARTSWAASSIRPPSSLKPQKRRTVRPAAKRRIYDIQEAGICRHAAHSYLLLPVRHRNQAFADFARTDSALNAAIVEENKRLQAVILTTQVRREKYRAGLPFKLHTQASNCDHPHLSSCSKALLFVARQCLNITASRLQARFALRWLRSRLSYAVSRVERLLSAFSCTEAHRLLVLLNDNAEQKKSIDEMEAFARQSC